MQKALVVCECFSDNIGDQAIAYAMKRKLEEFYSEVDLVDFSFRQERDSLLTESRPRGFVRSLVPESVRKTALFLIIKRIRFMLLHLFQALLVCRNSYDLAIIGGGQLIMENSSFPSSMFLWVHVLRFSRTPMKVVSVGASNSLRAFDRLLFKSALKSVGAIYARDNKSRSIVEGIVGKRCQLIPDVVYSLFQEAQSKTEDKRSLFVLSPVEYSVYKRYSKESNLPDWSEGEYIEQWVSVICEQKEKVVICPTTRNDYLFSVKVLSRYESNDRVYRPPEVVLKYPNSWEEYVSVVQRATAVCSGRMHALILGHISGARIIPFQLSDKLKYYSAEYADRLPQDLSKILDDHFKEIIG